MKISTRITNILRYLFFLFLVAIVNSCGEPEEVKPEPVADFSFTKDPNCKAPCAVTFTSNSQNARGYNWEFGDGETSTDNNPVHTFKKGGTFMVTLTAAGDGGIDRISKEVTIGSVATKMVIKKITLDEFPMNNPNGSGWDLNDAPDLFFILNGPVPDTTTIMNGRDIAYLNRTTGDLPLEWIMDAPYVTLVPLNREFVIELWDLDFGSDGDDQMSSIRFKPDSFVKLGTDKPYPETITIEDNGTTYTVEVEWE